VPPCNGGYRVHHVCNQKSVKSKRQCNITPPLSFYHHAIFLCNIAIDNIAILPLLSFYHHAIPPFFLSMSCDIAKNIFCTRYLPYFAICFVRNIFLKKKIFCTKKNLRKLFADTQSNLSSSFFHPLHPFYTHYTCSYICIIYAFYI